MNAQSHTTDRLARESNMNASFPINSHTHTTAAKGNIKYQLHYKLQTPS